MPIPTVHEFAAALQAAAADVAPAELAALSDPLLTAFEEVKSFRPLSIRPVKAPWEGAALAFEASWPDTHALLVAARASAEQEHSSAAQLRLSRAGQTIYAVNSTPEQLATDVALCLGRHMRHQPAAVAPAADSDANPVQPA